MLSRWSAVLVELGAGRFPSSRSLISATVHRLPASTCKQFAAISRNGPETTAGITGELGRARSQAGKRWVSTSTKVIPNCQTSAAAELAPVDASGGS